MKAGGTFAGMEFDSASLPPNTGVSIQQGMLTGVGSASEPTGQGIETSLLRHFKDELWLLMYLMLMVL